MANKNTEKRKKEQKAPRIPSVKKADRMAKKILKKAEAEASGIRAAAVNHAAEKKTTKYKVQQAVKAVKAGNQAKGFAKKYLLPPALIAFAGFAYYKFGISIKKEPDAKEIPEEKA